MNDKEIIRKINSLDVDGLQSLFWQVVGFISVKHEKEMDVAITECLK